MHLIIDIKVKDAQIITHFIRNGNINNIFSLKLTKTEMIEHAILQSDNTLDKEQLELFVQKHVANLDLFIQEQYMSFDYYVDE